MITVSRKKIAELINNANGIFSVEFIKRSTGEKRNMNCMLGSKTRKGLVGGDMKYSPSEYGLIPVYLMPGDVNRDIDPKNRRSIPIDGIISAKINGKQYKVG